VATSLHLDTARRPEGAVLIAVGEIDLSNVDAFDAALADATSEAAGRGETLVVDLSAVEYVDSAAINALFARSEHIRVVAHPLLMSILAMTGLTELITVDAAAPDR
jgi:anti-anti-sigma factor